MIKLEVSPTTEQIRQQHTLKHHTHSLEELTLKRLTLDEESLNQDVLLRVASNEGSGLAIRVDSRPLMERDFLFKAPVGCSAFPGNDGECHTGFQVHPFKRGLDTFLVSFLNHLDQDPIRNVRWEEKLFFQQYADYLDVPLLLVSRKYSLPSNNVIAW